MEVVVLPPQDILKRSHHHHNTVKSRRNPNPNPNPKPNPTNNQTNRSTRRRRSSNSPPPPPTGPVKAHHQPVVPAQIRILKRGEGLPAIIPAKPEPVATVRPVGPKPVFAGPVMNGFYAGSACVTSPSPSELPLPVFFTKSCGLSLSTDVGNDNHQKIANDLRRVLKLC